MQWRIRQLQNLPNATESPLYRNDAEVRKMIGSVHPGVGVVLGFTVPVVVVSSCGHALVARNGFESGFAGAARAP
jgi:hypothetical protein